jgi:hypothetical protein
MRGQDICFIYFVFDSSEVGFQLVDWYLVFIAMQSDFCLKMLFQSFGFLDGFLSNFYFMALFRKSTLTLFNLLDKHLLTCLLFPVNALKYFAILISFL